MLIVCPNCATSYRVTADHLGDTGREVRCVNCHTVWFEQPHQPVAPTMGEAPHPPAIDPTAIRPPLDDVIEIGTGSQPADDFADSPEIVLHPETDLPVEPVPGHSQNRAIEEMPAERAPMGPPRPVERVAALRARRRPATRRPALSRHALPASICALILMLACLVAARQQVVRSLPQTASLYAGIGLPVNLRGLAFENIKTMRDMQDGVPMLVVEGEIVGTTARHAEVPRLRFAVVDGAGKEIYAWTTRPARTLLPPGETMPFRSRLASPPSEASGISVRFFNRRDAQAGFM
ncbi:MAG: MJ0042-type zinc finger domain-containing protein [Pseudorhodoplanes sp.]|uniref:MJ0042-type zinc finger domain-containing protein n=1 Tax=Pseudorhodoplanes sp. TaxID=1934341 RepID=UPI003D1486AF